jgi:hypothetical protein
VNTFFVEPSADYETGADEADIGLTLTATTGTGLRAERRFYVKGSDEPSILPEGAYEAAVQQLIDASSEAIVELVDRFSPVAEGGSTAALSARDSIARGGAR